MKLEGYANKVTKYNCIDLMKFWIQVSVFLVIRNALNDTQSKIELEICQIFVIKFKYLFSNYLILSGSWILTSIL